MKTNDGRLIVVAGASRSGKTAWVKQETCGDPRIFAWDPEDQWAALPGWKRVTTRAALLAAIQAPGPGRVAYVAGGKLATEFDFWAGCMQYSARYVGPLTAIAEELADVTSPAKAPGNWGIFLRRGLKRGATIYAISQRWAEADKTAMGNASMFVIFRQATGPDARYMARYTRVTEDAINALPPLYFVKYDGATQETTPGQVVFSRQKATKSRV